MKNVNKEELVGILFSFVMYSLIMVGSNGEFLIECIIWVDGWSSEMFEKVKRDNYLF